MPHIESKIGKLYHLVVWLLQSQGHCAVIYLCLLTTVKDVDGAYLSRFHNWNRQNRVSQGDPVNHDIG